MKMFRTIGRMGVLFAAMLIAGCATIPASAPTLSEGAIIAAEIAAAPKADRAEIADRLAQPVDAWQPFRPPAGWRWPLAPRVGQPV